MAASRTQGADGATWWPWSCLNLYHQANPAVLRDPAAPQASGCLWACDQDPEGPVILSGQLPGISCGPEGAAFSRNQLRNPPGPAAPDPVLCVCGGHRRSTWPLSVPQQTQRQAGGAAAGGDLAHMAGYFWRGWQEGWAKRGSPRLEEGCLFAARAPQRRGAQEDLPVGLGSQRTLPGHRAPSWNAGWEEPAWPGALPPQALGRWLRSPALLLTPLPKGGR